MLSLDPHVFRYRRCGCVSFGSSFLRGKGAEGAPCRTRFAAVPSPSSVIGRWKRPKERPPRRQLVDAEARCGRRETSKNVRVERERGPSLLLLPRITTSPHVWRRRPSAPGLSLSPAYDGKPARMIRCTDEVFWAAKRQTPSFHNPSALHLPNNTQAKTSLFLPRCGEGVRRRPGGPGRNSGRGRPCSCSCCCCC